MNSNGIQSKEDVYKHITDRILNNSISPGERLVERELCAEYGISRTPMREILWRLENDGIIEQSPKFGTIVRKLTIDFVFEIFQTREAIEGMAARIVCSKGDELFMNRLRSINDIAIKKVKKMNFSELIKLGQEFHKLIIEGTKNSLFIEFYRKIAVLHGMTNNITYKYTEIENRSWDSHLKIIEAILDRNADDAERLMREHIRSTCRLISERFYPDLFKEK